MTTVAGPPLLHKSCPHIPNDGVAVGATTLNADGASFLLYVFVRSLSHFLESSRYAPKRKEEDSDHARYWITTLRLRRLQLLPQKDSPAMEALLRRGDHPSAEPPQQSKSPDNRQH
jgi:hypothetical protein